MLTINPLRPGDDHVSYYLGQTADPQDYYLTGGDSKEAPGVWRLEACRDLGLEPDTEVTDDQVRAIFGGVDPETGEVLHPERPGKDTTSWQRLDPYGNSKTHTRRPGFDLTYSAPKSVSALWALVDDDQQAEVVAAHQAAVAAAMDYMQREACRSRVGAGGRDQVRGDGFIAAEFLHRTARASEEGATPDPQLHSHVVVANLVRRPDGQWRTLDGRELYTHAKTSGYIYQAALRAELTRRLGVGWTDLEKGIGEVDGIPEELRDAWSKRRQQMLEELAARGGDVDNIEHRQAAILATRQAKEGGASTATLRDTWQADAAALGHARDQVLEHVAEAGRQWQPEHVDVHEFVESLTATSSTFNRRQLIQALTVAGVPVDELDDTADQLLADERIAHLTLDDFREQVGPAVEGRTVPTSKQGVFTTAGVLAAEARLIGMAERGLDGDRATVRDDQVDLAIASANDQLRASTGDPAAQLAGEQQQMVRHLTTGGHSVAVVKGVAGAGKTTAIAAARAGWDRAGVPVLGVSLSAKAAKVLEDETHIPSTTIAKMLHDLEVPDHHGATKRLPRGAVLVVDEAAFAGSKQLARLAGHIDEVDGKLVLVGDNRQFSAIEAGGLFAELLERTPDVGVELTENRRQKAKWERDALEQLRDVAEAKRAIGSWVEHGRVTVGEDTDATLVKIVDDYWQVRATPVGDGDDRRAAVPLMMALRRKDVDKLNAHALNRARDEGLVEGEPVEVGGKTWQHGMRVICTRNDRWKGVLNGTTGRVEDFKTHVAKWRTVVQFDDGHRQTLERDEAIQAGKTVWVGRGGDDRDPGTVLECIPSRIDRQLVIRTDDGEQRTLPADYVKDNVELGYATTLHKAQGTTVDAALTYAQRLDAQAMYVALSRGRGSTDADSIVNNRLYLDARPEPDDPAGREHHRQHVLERLQDMVGRDGEETAALGHARERLPGDLAELQDERRQLIRVLEQAPAGSEQLREQVTEQLADAEANLAAAANPTARQRWQTAVDDLREQLHELTPRDGHVPEVDRRRQEWLADHVDDLDRYEAVTSKLDRHAEAVATLRTTQRQLEDGAGYLPERPDSLLKRARWRTEVVAIETYRTRWGIDDPDRPLGPEPEVDPAQRREWQQIARAVGLDVDSDRDHGRPTL